MSITEGNNPKARTNIEARELLSKPFKEIKVQKLAEMPDKAFLKWLPTLEICSGLVFQEKNWYIVKSNEMGISRMYLPEWADVLAYSRPKAAKSEEHEADAIPSERDFHNCSETAKNLIISSVGITEYWHIKDPEGRKQIENEIFAFQPKFNNVQSLPAYKKFLEDIGAEYRIHTWRGISEKKLTELLHR